MGKTGMRGKTGMQNWLVATVAGKFFAPLVVDKCEIRVDEKFQSSFAARMLTRTHGQVATIDDIYNIYNNTVLYLISRRHHDRLPGDGTHIKCGYQSYAMASQPGYRSPVNLSPGKHAVNELSYTSCSNDGPLIARIMW